MNGKQSTRMRRHIDRVVPNMEPVNYVDAEQKPNRFNYSGNTGVRLGQCQRKFYQQLKRDVLRARRLQS